ncbi:hypothetical protein FHS96_001729 [Sphingomonas zeicaulis]
MASGDHAGYGGVHDLAPGGFNPILPRRATGNGLRVSGA